MFSTHDRKFATRPVTLVRLSTQLSQPPVATARLYAGTVDRRAKRKKLRSASEHDRLSISVPMKSNPLRSFPGRAFRTRSAYVRVKPFGLKSSKRRFSFNQAALRRVPL